MAGKKDFSAVRNGSVAGIIGQATSGHGKQEPASPEEQQQRKEELRTRGRKGCKAIRINMILTPANHDFIKTVALMTGKTMTELMNEVISQYREEHAEVYDKAVKLRQELQGDTE